MYTIKREIGTLDGIKLGLVGDLANGRTVRSLAYLIAKYQNIKIYFVSPDVVKMKVLVLLKNIFDFVSLSSFLLTQNKWNYVFFILSKG